MMSVPLFKSENQFTTLRVPQLIKWDEPFSTRSQLISAIAKVDPTSPLFSDSISPKDTYYGCIALLSSFTRYNNPEVIPYYIGTALAYHAYASYDQEIVQDFMSTVNIKCSTIPHTPPIEWADDLSRYWAENSGAYPALDFVDPSPDGLINYMLDYVSTQSTPKSFQQARLLCNTLPLVASALAQSNRHYYNVNDWISRSIAQTTFIHNYMLSPRYTFALVLEQCYNHTHDPCERYVKYNNDA